MFKTRKFFPAGIGVLILSCVSIVSARGRKPDYEDRQVYVPPARRGSAANHNNAFSPPRFDNDPFAPKAAPRSGSANTPPSYNYGYDKPVSGTKAASRPTTAPAAVPLTPTSTVLPSNSDGLQAPAPQPTAKTKVTPADQGVPTLPGFDSSAAMTPPPTPPVTPTPPPTPVQQKSIPAPVVVPVPAAMPPEDIPAPPPAVTHPAAATPPPVAPADEGVPTLPGFDAPTGGGSPANNSDGLQSPVSHPTPTTTTTTTPPPPPPASAN